MNMVEAKLVIWSKDEIKATVATAMGEAFRKLRNDKEFASMVANITEKADERFKDDMEMWAIAVVLAFDPIINKVVDTIYKAKREEIA